MNALSVILLSIATILASTHPVNSTKPDRPDARIVNGTAATAGQFPYQVSLRSGVLPKHFCGGAIIADRWILTAAQCTVGRRPRSFVAIVGSASLSFGGVKYHIDQSHPHPKYTDNDFNFDIALVRTTKQIHFSQIVQPIALPQGGHIKPHSEVIISGWGNDATYFTQLQYLESLTISSIECKQLVPTANQTLSSLLCHQHENGGACFGDYGRIFEVFLKVFRGY